MKALKCQVKEIAVGWLKLEEALHRDFTWFKKKKRKSNQDWFGLFGVHFKLTL